MIVIQFQRKADRLAARQNSKRKTSGVIAFQSAQESSNGLVDEIGDSLTIIKGYLQFFEKNTTHCQPDWLEVVFNELNRVEVLIAYLQRNDVSK